MEFRTELKPKRAANITLQDRIVTIGSCFADDMGERLIDNKFQVVKNPFGTVYNPISIFQQIQYAMAKSGATAAGFVQRDGLFFHHDFHSSWVDSSQESLRAKLRSRIELMSKALKDCKVLMITLGTAWCYELISNNHIVANCHKLPQKAFNKFLLNQKGILNSFKTFHQRFQGINPNARIILTVSPVRHIKDSLELNSVSKSILRLTCHTLTETFADVEYFPAYEIMMDDLRDYRFYEPDMIHPTQQAVDYIWERFTATYFNDETMEFLRQWNSIKMSLNHKPFQPESESHQKFLKETLEKLKTLSTKADLTGEIEVVMSELKNHSWSSGKLLESLKLSKS
jgi:hypothetical protein